LQNIGLSYCEQQEPQLAVAYFEEALHLQTAISNRRGVAAALNGLGKSFLLLKKYAAAAATLKRASEEARAAGSLSEERSAYATLAAVSEAQNRPQEAFTYFRKEMVLKDSIFSQSNARYVAGLQTTYELAQREKQLALYPQSGRSASLTARTAAHPGMVYCYGLATYYGGHPGPVEPQPPEECG
jgi:tetratricopeptide (TPR) repeat protein